MNEKLTDEYLNKAIYVCDVCLQASCLQGIFMCEQAYGAGMTTRTRSELIKLGKENEDYMHN
jgi:hypothetical protein